ncbi:peptidyl-prolyl cis-trans isomerase C [Amphritea atlantica]|uniref:peptidylprolyl isomerase n=1 Tax=Amphritea atlantica TaxID=355243 RepID=A0A1H9KNY1_9GAMM|nr:nitrogen fixation protein NifM [Amphritea atlantica]SER00860.1 peptidyl-prolyl cis-trans isomerase C [Amphritea atlantica]
MVNHGDSPEAIYALFKLSWSQFECAPDQLDARQRSEAASLIANQLEIERVILSSDQSQGVVISEGQVKKSLEEIIERYENAAAFEQALEQADLTLALLREGIRRDLLVEATLDRVSASTPEVSDAEAELFYYFHPDKFSVTERRTAHHILITVNDDYDENRADRALARINEIRERVLKKKTRFNEQAQKHSECPTALHGGKIGNVERGQLYPELDDVLFAMQAGEVSEPVLSSIGYHLLYCTGIEQPRKLPLEEVLPKLKASLRDRQQSIYQRQWIKEQLKHQTEMPKAVNS